VWDRAEMNALVDAMWRNYGPLFRTFSRRLRFACNENSKKIKILIKNQLKQLLRPCPENFSPIWFVEALLK
jgi:hypothetical protein